RSGYVIPTLISPFVTPFAPEAVDADDEPAVRPIASMTSTTVAASDLRIPIPLFPPVGAVHVRRSAIVRRSTAKCKGSLASSGHSPYRRAGGRLWGTHERRVRGGHSLGDRRPRRDRGAVRRRHARRRGRARGGGGVPCRRAG